MNNETKNEVKKNVATGASTAAGATAGVVIGAAITPNSAEGAEVVKPDPTPQPAPAPKPTNQSTSTAAHTQAPTHTSQTPQTETSTNTGAQTPPPGQENNDIEVLSYDRVTNEDGSQMDIAVLNVNGNEVGVIDANLDGEADALMCDLNQNGVIEQGEIEIVQGQGIAMQPLADAAGFNPQFAQNDLPDYVNDADVDTYMA